MAAEALEAVEELIAVGVEAGVPSSKEEVEVIEGEIGVVGVEVEVIDMGDLIKKMVKKNLRMNAELTLAPKGLPRRTTNTWMRISQMRRNSLSFMSS